MNLHQCELQPLPDGVIRVLNRHGVLLSEVWRRTEGDDLTNRPYSAAITLTPEDDDLWPVDICATETEAIEAVIRWSSADFSGE